MQLNILKPTTNGCRHQNNLKKNLLSKNNNLLKLLQQGVLKKSGRSSITGRITIRHKGGGCKQKLRNINFSNNELYSLVITTFYDPIRNSFITLNYNFLLHFFNFSLATLNLLPGSLISCSKTKIYLKLGSRMTLSNIPVGSLIHSLSLSQFNKTAYIRSAGTSGLLIQKSRGICKIKLPSRSIIEVLISAYATVGILSNIRSNSVVLGKAGKNRLMNKRSQVRGVAMNPVDHPHGGRTNGGRPSVTPWGKITKGKPTVKKKNESLKVERSFFRFFFIKKKFYSKILSRKNIWSTKIKIWSRRSTVLSNMIGLKIYVYNGQKFIPVVITKEKVGFKFGEFSYTRNHPNVNTGYIIIDTKKTNKKKVWVRKQI